jgi:hypothetical protein
MTVIEFYDLGNSLFIIDKEISSRLIVKMKGLTPQRQQSTLCTKRNSKAVSTICMVD